MEKAATSKELVRGVFDFADVEHLPFIPWVFTHAARLEQLPLRRIYGDPTQYVKCLQNAQKLYGYDAIISGFDASLEAELCGCALSWKGDYEAPAAAPLASGNLGHLAAINEANIGKSGRTGTVMESMRRIGMVSGSTLALAAVVTGPLTLTATLLGRDVVRDLLDKPDETKKSVEMAVAFLLKVIQTYCELEPDLVVVADRLVPALPAVHWPWLRSTMGPIVNTVRFYNAFSVLLPGESTPSTLANMIELSFDGIVAGEVDIKTWNGLRGGRPCVLGKAIPSRLLTSGKAALGDYLKNNLPAGVHHGVFLTTDWEVPAAASPEVVHLLTKTISS
ncbi:MAG: uroporphyrinogen decarboxylase family protein [Chloroflexota bacterium]